MGDVRLTATLEGLIVALCADFDRRREAIASGRIERRTDTELRYLNYKLLDAAAEIVGEGESEIYIREIGAHTGYAASRSAVSESTYKKYKMLVKASIAKKLHLK